MSVAGLLHARCGLGRWGVGRAGAGWLCVLALAGLGWGSGAQASTRSANAAGKSHTASAPHTTSTRHNPAPPPRAPSSPEARLIDVFKLVGREELGPALERAQALVRDVPQFALAQLVYADLLSARTRPLHTLGDLQAPTGSPAAQALAELRAESRLRLRALQERPPAGLLPAELLKLAPQTRHAIAIDASRSRLYWFENRDARLTLLGDYYISVGKLGIDKRVEGDQRTPLGVYHITSQIDRRSLADYYGAGALPINYPNVLDQRRGKTGSGIWLHGTPQAQYSRPPQASDGCVVLANPDLKNLLGTVAVGSTPVVISPQISWISPAAAATAAVPIEQRLAAWVQAKNSANPAALARFYARDFNADGKTHADWMLQIERDLRRLGGGSVQIKDLSVLRWRDSQETWVVTFGEVQTGRRSGVTRRQYWQRQGDQWSIFYEGVLS